MVIQSRRSPLQGVLIQPTRISQDTHGWDNRQSSLESGIGFYAPITALPFGTTMHPEQCGCEGCRQEGVAAMQGLGDDPENPPTAESTTSQALTLAKYALLIGAAYFVYREIKKSSEHIKSAAERLRKASIAGLEALKQ
jgi:hypothetical protein